MFNMTKIRASNGAGKSFYANHLAANDYYSESEKIEGYWKGTLVHDFNLLNKNVELEAFSLFQRGINPVTGGNLTQRKVTGGPRFFDFQVAAPKSVSIMSLFDKRLLEAHREAVDTAMGELENIAAVRLRTGDNAFTNNFEMTGQIIYAQFHHDASRALDPQLHTHNVVVNVTIDSDGKYKALESVEMCRAIRYAGKVYHNKLSELCMQLGYELENHYDDKGRIVWKDIKEIPEEIMELYSKRRRQIEELEAEFIAEHGRKPTLSENNQLSMSSRASKMKHATSDEVRKYQLSQLSPEQNRVLFRKADQVKWTQPQKKWISPDEVQKALREALSSVFERESVVKLDKVLAEAMNQHLGEFSLERLKGEVRNLPELKELGGLKGNPWVSPQEVIDREIYAIESVENQREVFDGIAPEFEAFPGEESRRKQAELIHGMLSSKDRFNLFRGVAGAGKTSTLQEFCHGLRSGGIENIYLIAPTNSATDVLKEEGFEQSQTVTSFLLNKEKPPAGSYVIIDESGLNSLREGVEIIKTARENNYRVLFMGDARQHTAVESGDFFRLLEEHSEIGKFSLTDIYRQQNEEYRRGIMECALGQFEQAFERFEKNHFIHEGKAKYLEEAAQSYMDYTDNGRDISQAILVAPTHEEGDRLTDAVRRKLKAHGAVSENGRPVSVFRSWNWEKSRLKQAENYPPGTVVSFIRNRKGIGKAGETACVDRVENGMLYLDSGKVLSARSAADFIEVGELREIELCRGDLIQFNVNLRERKIYNGTIGRLTDDPAKVMLLYSDGKERGLVDFPEGYASFKYGWMTTSYKSQGRTAENVVVAAQSLDRKAFYVSLSRGRKHMALHCPEKDFLKEQLSFRHGERRSVHDLIRDREIPPGSILPLSDEARAAQHRMLPNTLYKSVKGRALKLAAELKKLARTIWSFGAEVASRRGRNAKYGLEILTEERLLEIERNAAIDTQKILERKRQEQELQKSGVKHQAQDPFDELLDFITEKDQPLQNNGREEIHDIAERNHAIAALDALFTKGKEKKQEPSKPLGESSSAMPDSMPPETKVPLSDDARLLAESQAWVRAATGDIPEMEVPLSNDARLLAETREWLDGQLGIDAIEQATEIVEKNPKSEHGTQEWLSENNADDHGVQPALESVDALKERLASQEKLEDTVKETTNDKSSSLAFRRRPILTLFDQEPVATDVLQKKLEDMAREAIRTEAQEAEKTKESKNEPNQAPSLRSKNMTEYDEEKSRRVIRKKRNDGPSPDLPDKDQSRGMDR
ncbi:MAG: Multifunctional conjugation protein TraI [Lentisphaerae bacterium ADurb.Bin242]|nr:MAG: Multifunctional conjugation protein TraI [Lentisphaerae bacterium ADurb.Bin242]